MRRLCLAALVALALVREVHAGGTELMPRPGKKGEDDLARDLGAGGIVTGTFVVATLATIPAWGIYLRDTPISVVNEEGEAKARALLLRGAVIGGVSGPVLGWSAFMATGGTGYRPGWAFVGAFAGAAAATPVGLGLGYLVARPMFRSRNPAGDVNYMPPFTSGTLIWYGLVAVGSSAGFIIGAGPPPPSYPRSVYGQRTVEPPKLFLQTVETDAGTAWVPTLEARW